MCLGGKYYVLSRYQVYDVMDIKMKANKIPVILNSDFII